MNTSKLQEFVTKTAAKNRITFGDVRRLQRDVLPDGVACRAEAELLIRLDGGIARSDAAWTDWLVTAIVDFVVWVERPTGAVEDEAALWLIGLLSERGSATRAGRRIVREIRCEAERVAAPLAAYEAGEETALPGSMLLEVPEAIPAPFATAA